MDSGLDDLGSNPGFATSWLHGFIFVPLCLGFLTRKMPIMVNLPQQTILRIN